MFTFVVIITALSSVKSGARPPEEEPEFELKLDSKCTPKLCPWCVNRNTDPQTACMYTASYIEACVSGSGICDEYTGIGNLQTCSGTLYAGTCNNLGEVTGECFRDYRKCLVK
jgi:hypothetical protein